MGRPSIFQALRMREEAEQGTPAPVVKAYQGTYADKLRVVGWHFDQNDHGSVSIMEVPGGLLARVLTSDGASEELIEFPDDAFAGLYEEVTTRPDQATDQLRIKSELIPTSYEEVLWALGARLDEWAARSLVFAECQPYLFVTGQRLVDSSMHSRYADFQEVLYPADVDVMITEFQPERGGYR